MSKVKPAIPDLILAELQAGGLPWRAEAGRDHTKIFICNRLALVVKRGAPAHRESDRRGLLNGRACVRRAIKEARNAQP